MLLHVPYYSDLSPCNFFLFPQLKQALTGQCCADNQAIQTVVTKQLFSISYKVLTRAAVKTSRNTASGVPMHEEAISKEILSTRV
jgi:Holliday junction resolvasome RuvABC endonuclease subunit